MSLIKLILINYITASLLGLYFITERESVLYISKNLWLNSAIIIGILFFVFFVFIGYAAQNIGIATTTIAGKMSMAIPILFSILYFHEDLSVLKAFGLFLALIAVFLISYKKEANKLPLKHLVLPVIIFLGSGIIDSLVKYAQHLYIENNETLLFSTIVFLISSIAALLYTFIIDRNFNQFLKPSLWIAGIILGLVNFGSLFFFIMTLNSKFTDSSIVFGINNLGIVTLSVLIGIMLFSEEFSRINIIGFIVSFFSIFILTIL